jgi:uncharacterized protein involved in cysteine biosynthesis
VVILPFRAAKLLFTRPKLFFFALFPGIFTFAASAGAVYLLWAFVLQGMTLWLSVPFMMMGFLLAWLLFGNLSLLPVEDAIIDECQKAQVGEIRFRSPGMSFRRVGREAIFSVVLAVAGIIFFFLSFVPLLGFFSFLFAAWLTAYGFLGSLYARQNENLAERLRRFFRDGLANFFLGAFVGALLFVPIVNVFLLGYAQILASLVFLRREEALKNIVR